MAATSRRLEKAKISTIFFDLDNTLIPTRKGDRIACYKVQSLLLDSYGFSLEASHSATQNFLKSFRKCPQSPDYPLHEWRRLLWKKSLGENHADILGDIYCQWMNLRYKYLVPSREVINLLENLGKKYYLGLITNGPSDSQWEKIKRLHLSQYFQVIVVSGDVKWKKPCEKIFLEACRRLDVTPEECLMVGDQLETDILGASKAGFGGTVWVPLPKTVVGDGGTPLEEDSAVEPSTIISDFVLRDITQLSYLLTSTSFPIDDPDVEDSCSNFSDGS